MLYGHHIAKVCLSLIMSLADLSASVSFGAPAIFAAVKNDLNVPTFTLPSITHDVFFGSQGIPYQCNLDSQGAFVGITASAVAISNAVVNHITTNILNPPWNSLGPVYYSKNYTGSKNLKSNTTVSMTNNSILTSVDNSTIGGWILHLFTNFINSQIQAYPETGSRPGANWIVDQSSTLTTFAIAQLTSMLSSQQFNQQLLETMLLMTQSTFDSTNTAMQYMRPRGPFPTVKVQMNLNLAFAYNLNGQMNKTVSLILPIKFSISPGTFQDLTPNTLSMNSLTFTKITGTSFEVLNDTWQTLNGVSINNTASFRMYMPASCKLPRYMMFDQLPYIECDYFAVTVFYSGGTVTPHVAYDKAISIINLVPIITDESIVKSIPDITYITFTILNQKHEISYDIMTIAKQQIQVYFAY